MAQALTHARSADFQPTLVSCDCCGKPATVSRVIVSGIETYACRACREPAAPYQTSSHSFYRGLHDICGRRFAHTWFVTTSTGAVMPWIESEIASRFDCDPEDVSLYEDDDGQEMIVVDGNPVAFLTCREDWYTDGER